MGSITSQRLVHQQLSQQQFTTPAEVVGWLGAVQSQDYGGAKWALGQRLPGYTDALIDEAFNEGTILRTHVLRPTWHFVTPEDIRWMIELTAPRVNAFAAYQYRQAELDDAIFSRSNDVFVKSLEGGKQLTREELSAALTEAGIHVGSPLRFSHIVFHAELDALVCSGARRGKQMTYALLDERAPQARSLPREEALAELTRRYFQSHGPATVHDFSWWSGLTVADAKAGIAMLNAELVCEEIDGQTYWLMPTEAAADNTAYLLPNFDEYTVAYKDRTALFGKWEVELDVPGEVMVMNYVIVIGGRVVGQWKRTIKSKAVELQATFFRSLTAAENQAFIEAVERFSTFMNLPVVLK